MIKKFLFITVFGVLLAFSLQAVAEQITLEWEPPTERVDNSQYLHPAETDHFDIYNAADGTPVVVDIDKTLTEVVHDFVSGPHSIVVTITDIDGRESAYSPILNFTAGTAPKGMQVFRVKARAQSQP